MKEYATTTGTYRQEHDRENGGYDVYADDPSEPSTTSRGVGSPWRHIGMAAADGILFWTWERDA